MLISNQNNTDQWATRSTDVCSLNTSSICRFIAVFLLQVGWKDKYETLIVGAQVHFFPIWCTWVKTQSKSQTWQWCVHWKVGEFVLLTRTKAQDGSFKY